MLFRTESSVLSHFITSNARKHPPTLTHHGLGAAGGTGETLLFLRGRFQDGHHVPQPPFPSIRRRQVQASRSTAGRWLRRCPRTGRRTSEAATRTILAPSRSSPGSSLAVSPTHAPCRCSSPSKYLPTRAVHGADVCRQAREEPYGKRLQHDHRSPGTDDGIIHAFTRSAESYLKSAMAGVVQADFAPRNIFLIGDLRDPRLRAVVSDFNVAKVFSRMNPSRPPPKLADPISFCANPDWGAHFRHWLPKWFFTDEDKRNSRLSIEFPSMIHEASGNSEIGT